LFAPYAFDTAARRVMRTGTPIDLTRREFDLALYLFRHADRVLSRECLLENIWGPQRRDLNTRTVDTHVSRLRKKLGLAASGWRLAAVYQHGYRLESPPAAT
jgi:DNA-binding response OmpR family regulator